MESYPGNVPVIVDDVKKDVGIARCIYFTVECDEPQPTWTLALQDKSIPIIVLGLSAIIHSPISSGHYFDSPEMIEEFMDMVEESSGLHVETSSIWIPTRSFPGSEPVVDKVYRVDTPLFIHAWRIGMDEFPDFDDEAGVAGLGEAVYSKGESEAFNEWAQQTLARTREAYHRNRGEFLNRKTTSIEPEV